MSEFLRRIADQEAQEADKTETKILELIESTHDSKDKAFLLILLKINSSISNNTSIVTNVANKLDKHLTVFETHADEELQRLNHGAGVKKVLSYISGLIQTVLFAMVIYFQSSLIELRDLTVQQEITITRNTTMLQNHDRVIDQLSQKVNK